MFRIYLSYGYGYGLIVVEVDVLFIPDDWRQSNVNFHALRPSPLFPSLFRAGLKRFVPTFDTETCAE